MRRVTRSPRANLVRVEVRSGLALVSLGGVVLCLAIFLLWWCLLYISRMIRGAHTGEPGASGRQPLKVEGLSHVKVRVVRGNT
jgi:hypothetical protein